MISGCRVRTARRAAGTTRPRDAHAPHPVVAPIAGQAGEHGQPVRVHPLGPGQHRQHREGLRTVGPRQSPGNPAERSSPTAGPGRRGSRPPTSAHVARRSASGSVPVDEGTADDPQDDHGRHQSGRPGRRASGWATAAARRQPSEPWDPRKRTAAWPAAQRRDPHPLADQEDSRKAIPSEQTRPSRPTSSSRWTTSHAVARPSNTRSSAAAASACRAAERAVVGQEVVGATHHRPSMAAPGSAVEVYSALASPQPCQWSTRIQQLTRGRSRLA